MPVTPRVTLLGTGTMGLGMAHSILRAGLPLTVWNRSPEKAEPLRGDGATVATSLADAVREAHVVVTMLFDVDSVAAVIEEAASAMPADAVWLQTSTVGRDGTARLAELARQHGITLVDAPVIGTKGPAEEGKLTVLASGPASAAVDAVLDAVGGRTVRLGDEPGPASALKLVANGWVAAINAAAAQAVVQARAFDVDPAAFLDAMAGGAADSPYLQAKARAILEDRTSDPQFALDGVVKDLGLIREATAERDVPTDLVDALLGLYRRASDAGHGGEDMAAVAAAFQPGR